MLLRSAPVATGRRAGLGSPNAGGVLMNLALERHLNLHERNEDGREVERGRIGASGLASREAPSRSGVEAELQLPRR